MRDCPGQTSTTNMHAAQLCKAVEVQHVFGFDSHKHLHATCAPGAAVAVGCGTGTLGAMAGASGGAADGLATAAGGVGRAREGGEVVVGDEVDGGSVDARLVIRRSVRRGGGSTSADMQRHIRTFLHLQPVMCIRNSTFSLQQDLTCKLAGHVDARYMKDLLTFISAHHIRVVRRRCCHLRLRW